MKAVVAFDLDDTLYKEVDFVYSAYAAVADKLKCYGCDKDEVYETMQYAFESKSNPIDAVIKRFNQPLSESELVELYRKHKPEISLSGNVRNMLLRLKGLGFDLALITDGRFVTQYNKVRALGLTEYFSERAILISEVTGCDKTVPDNFLRVQRMYGNAGKFFYIGDNPAKDFLQPNLLGWVTICVKDDGRNIHSQSVRVPDSSLPRYIVNDISEIPQLVMEFIKN